MWAAAIGVLSVILAAMLFRLLPAGGLVFVGLLLACVGLLAAVIGLLVEIPPAVGGAGGALAAVLVAVILGLTIAAAPLGLGAQRPGFSDLLWKPLFALVGVIAVCAAAGWSGARLGLKLARRGGGGTPPV